MRSRSIGTGRGAVTTDEVAIVLLYLVIGPRPPGLRPQAADPQQLLLERHRDLHAAHAGQLDQHHELGIGLVDVGRRAPGASLLAQAESIVVDCLRPAWFVVGGEAGRGGRGPGLFFHRFGAEAGRFYHRPLSGAGGALAVAAAWRPAAGAPRAGLYSMQDVVECPSGGRGQAPDRRWTTSSTFYDRRRCSRGSPRRSCKQSPPYANPAPSVPGRPSPLT